MANASTMASMNPPRSAISAEMSFHPPNHKPASTAARLSARSASANHVNVTEMKTTDPRDLTWEEIREHLAGARERIWEELLAHGPKTTSVLAWDLDMSLLTVRPRVCELAALGFVECIGREGREGIYRAVSIELRKSRHEEDLREESQLPLKLS